VVYGYQPSFQEQMALQNQQIQGQAYLQNQQFQQQQAMRNGYMSPNGSSYGNYGQGSAQGYTINPPQTQYAPDGLYGAMASVMNNQNTNQTQYGIAEGNANAEMARLMQQLLFQQGQTTYRTGYEDQWNQRQNDTTRYGYDQNLAGQLGVADRNMQGQLGVAGINSQTALGTAGINAGAQNYATDAQRQAALAGQQNQYNIANLQNQGGITQAQIAANASTVPAYLRQDRFNSVLPLLNGLFYGPGGAPQGTTQGSPGMVNSMQAPPPQLPSANTNQPSANVDTSNGQDLQRQIRGLQQSNAAAYTQRPAPVASPTNRPTQAFHSAPSNTQGRNLAAVPANYTPRPGVAPPGGAAPAAMSGPVPTGRPTMPPGSPYGGAVTQESRPAIPPSSGMGNGAYTTPQDRLRPDLTGGGSSSPFGTAGTGPVSGGLPGGTGGPGAPGGGTSPYGTAGTGPVATGLPPGTGQYGAPGGGMSPFGTAGTGPVSGGLPMGTGGPGAPGGGQSLQANPFGDSPPPAASPAAGSAPPGYMIDDRGRTVRDRSSQDAARASRSTPGAASIVTPPIQDPGGMALNQVAPDTRTMVNTGGTPVPFGAGTPLPPAPPAATTTSDGGGGLIGGGGILGLLGGSSSSSGGAPAGNQPTIAYAPPSTPQMWQQQVNQEIGRNAASVAAQNQDATRSMAARYGANSPALQSILNRNNVQLAGLNQQARVGIPMQGQQAYSNYMMNYGQALENQYANRQREALQRQQISVGSIAPLLNAIAGFAG
jgi:hypothetical protein